LTNVFHDSRLLPQESNIVLSYMSARIHNGVGHSLNNVVLCVYMELDETRSSLWRLAALFLSVFGGIGAGVKSKNAQLGLDVGTGMLAILLVLQGSLKPLSN
jgi:hypothetical protein